jgi:NosR/NirI family nitrous oxide reductase transcriptional regulator
MSVSDFSNRLPWRKISLTTLIAAAYGFFWINGPLQEAPPVFEFHDPVMGFSAPLEVGETIARPKFGVVDEYEEALFYRIIPVREKALPTYGFIGDARNSPSLTKEVAELVMAGAEAQTENSEAITLKAGLDMFYVELRNSSGDLQSLYLENTGLNKHIKGYSGPIDIAMVVGLDGSIQKIEHLRSAETTSYLRDIESSGFYEQFKNIPLDGESYQVDALTGATLTTRAIAKSVSALVSIGRESPLEIYVDSEPEGFLVKAKLPDTWILNAALITAFFAFARMKKVRKSKRFVMALNIMSVLYLGFFLNNSFTYVTFIQPFMGSGWSYMLGVYATVVLVSAIWDGNAYCRYVCPYGNVQRLLLRVTPIRGKFPVSNEVLRIGRWILTLVLFGGIVSGFKDWGSFELFPDLFGLEFMESQWFWLSAALVLISAYYPMLWCKLLCPTGAVLDTITEFMRPSRARKLAQSSAVVTSPVTIVDPAKAA